MIKIDQKSFYSYVGRELTLARQRRNISITKLAQLSGEQHKTIKSIEDGLQRCSLHHAVWMRSLLGLDLNELARDYQEGSNEHGRIEFPNGSSIEFKGPGSTDILKGSSTELFYSELDELI